MKFASTKTAVFFALSLAFLTTVGVANASQSEVDSSVNQGERIEDSIAPQQQCTPYPWC